MQDDIEQKVKITYDTNADQAAKDVNKLDKAVDTTVKTQKKAVKSTKDQKGSLEDLGGGIGSTISGFKGLIKQMWLLVANPVGAIIAAVAVALTTLFKAFTSTKGGAEKFEQVMDGIGATIDVIRDRILKFAGAIGKFLTGDFSGAFEDAKSVYTGFGEEIAREFRIAADARKSLQEVADAMRDLSVSRAELDRDLAESERILTDINATYEEKKKALEEVERAEAKQTNAELENAKKKLEAIQAQNAQSDSSAEALDAEAEARIAVIELERKSSENRRKVAEFNIKLTNEEKARVKELTDARKAAAAERAKLAEEEIKEIERINKLKLSEEERALRAIQDLNDKTEEEKLERKKERDLEAIEQLRQQGVDVRNLLIYNDELYNTLEDELREKRAEEKAVKDEEARQKALEAQKKQAEEEKKIEEAKLAQKQAIEDAERGLISGALNFAKQAFSKNKGIQKGILIAENAAALAKITMNTVEAVAKDNAASPLTLGNPWSSIHIAQGTLGAANVIASTARGLKELGGGSAGSAPNMGGARGGASARPEVGFQASSENQIATSIADNTNEMPPVEAFVVESQVTSKQAAARKRVENNSF
jgi:hypothetical protein